MGMQEREGEHLAGCNVGTIVGGMCNMMMDCTQFVLCSECDGRTDETWNNAEVNVNR